jgi:hypothetical protein
MNNDDIRNAYFVSMAWQDEGFASPQNYASCRSPFREDRRPSFSIYDDGRKWKDHGSGEAGSIFDFVAKANNCDFKSARKIILNRLGRGMVGSIVQRQPGMDRKQLRLPPMHSGTKSELNQLASLRNLSIESLTLSSEQGWLWFTQLMDNGKSHKAWILTDSTRRNAQARRLDGKCWQHLPGKPKAKTLPGSQAGWPIGIADIGNKNHVSLCEGGPDFLAAIHFARNEGKEDVHPVFMSGASLNIHPEALGLFKGKKIKIFPHLDDVGVKAAKKWANQLYAAGASEVIGFGFNGLTQTNGEPVCDLNDLAYQDTECWEKKFHSRELFNFN